MIYRLILLLAILATISPVKSEEIVSGVKLYHKVPSAYELATTLFPPKTRSVILDGVAVTSQAKPAVKAIGFNIKFKYDSVEILPESQAYLDSLGKMLKFEKLKDKALVIDGHADATGGTEYNLQLSLNRAKTIKDYLVKKHGIGSNRLHTLGHGESRLLDPSNPYAAINRRAEFRAKDHQ